MANFRRNIMSRNPPSLTGKKIGRLQVHEIVKSDYNGRHYRCTCDCGNERTATAYRLTHGIVKSCGCLSCRYHGTKKINANPAFKLFLGLPVLF
jgi:hypothetical protein